MCGKALPFRQVLLPGYPLARLSLASVRKHLYHTEGQRPAAHQTGAAPFPDCKPTHLVLLLPIKSHDVSEPISANPAPTNITHPKPNTQDSSMACLIDLRVSSSRL